MTGLGILFTESRYPKRRVSQRMNSSLDVAGSAAL